MNTRIASVLIFAAALSSSALTPLSAASKNDRPTGYPVSRINFPSSGFEHIAPGATQGAVFWLMGSPTQTVSPEVWIYSGYQANLDLANEQNCNTLVITFAKGKVVDMKLVNKPAVSIIAANPSSKQPERYASTK